MELLDQFDVTPPEYDDPELLELIEYDPLPPRVVVPLVEADPDPVSVIDQPLAPSVNVSW